MPPMIPTFHAMGQPVNLDSGDVRVAAIDERLSRTDYFDGRLLTATDLNRDQTYLDQRLREIGQVLGSGVVDGLAATLSTATQTITIQPGLGIARSGRVLALDHVINVPLANPARLQLLNGGTNARIAGGLYAVVLLHAEYSRGIAEVFPTDLGTRRTAQPNVVVEGCEVALMRLDQALPPGSPARARAVLAPALIRGVPVNAVPDEAVILGVLAVENGGATWLDQALLRQPLREQGPGALQRSLYRHFLSLFEAVMDERGSRAFQASDYFRVLPPAGKVPKSALDPAAGWQSFFPAAWTVQVAPVRSDDLATLIEEAMLLDPLDLERVRPAEVMILAPLPPEVYAPLAAKIETPKSNVSKLEFAPRIEALRLRLVSRIPTTSLDTDSGAWAEIWKAVGDRQVHFVRRAPRAAETGVSAIVIARGHDQVIEPDLPNPPAPTPVPPVDSAPWFDWEQLMKLRPAPEGATNAQKQLRERVTDEVPFKHLITILLAFDRAYDLPLWLTLRDLAEKKQLETLAKGSAEIMATENVAESVLKYAEQESLTLRDESRKAWEEIGNNLRNRRDLTPEPVGPAPSPAGPTPTPAPAPAPTPAPAPARDTPPTKREWSQMVVGRPVPATATKAATAVQKSVTTRVVFTQVSEILAAFKPVFDVALWPTLRDLVETEQLSDLLKFTPRITGSADIANTLLAIAERQSWPLATDTVAAWKKLAGAGPVRPL